MKLRDLISLIDAHQKAKERLAMQYHRYYQMPSGTARERQEAHINNIQLEIDELLDTDIS